MGIKKEKSQDFSFLLEVGVFCCRKILQRQFFTGLQKNASLGLEAFGTAAVIELSGL